METPIKMTKKITSKSFTVRGNLLTSLSVQSFLLPNKTTKTDSQIILFAYNYLHILYSIFQ